MIIIHLWSRPNSVLGLSICITWPWVLEQTKRKCILILKVWTQFALLNFFCVYQKQYSISDRFVPIASSIFSRSSLSKSLFPKLLHVIHQDLFLFLYFEYLEREGRKNLIKVKNVATCKQTPHFLRYLFQTIWVFKVFENFFLKPNCLFSIGFSESL